MSHWKGIYLYFYFVKIQIFDYRIIATSWSCLNSSSPEWPAYRSVNLTIMASDDVWLGASRYLNQCWFIVKWLPVEPISLINLLGPSEAIWRQRSGSTLAPVMACCLTAPSHYLNQCWLIISKVKWHSSKGKFTRDTSAINHWNYL